MRWPIFIVVFLLFAAGCSSGPKHLSGGDFQRAYQANKMQTLDWYSYLGETNGAIYMRRTRVALSVGRPQERIFFTETNGLTEGFLEQMLKDSKVEPDGAANRSQPIPFQTSQTPKAAGSGR